MKRIILTGVGLAASALALPVAADTTSRGLALQPLEVQAAESSIHVNEILVQAKLDKDTATYAVGDEVELEVELSRSAYLTVLNVAPDGQTTILFPNRFNRDSFIPAATTVTVPGQGARIVATEPAGVDLVKVIASAKPIDLSTVVPLERAGSYDVTPPGGEKIISRALKTMKDGQRADPAASGWGEAVLRIATVSTTPKEDISTFELSPFASSIKLDLEALEPEVSHLEPISFKIVASRACDLTLIAVDQSGKTTVILPSLGGGDTTVPAGVPMKIQGVLPSTGLEHRWAGVATIKALCTAMGIEGAEIAEATTTIQVIR